MIVWEKVILEDDIDGSLLEPIMKSLILGNAVLFKHFIDLICRVKSSLSTDFLL